MSSRVWPGADSNPIGRDDGSRRSPWLLGRHPSAPRWSPAPSTTKGPRLLPLPLERVLRPTTCRHVITGARAAATSWARHRQAAHRRAPSSREPSAGPTADGDSRVWVILCLPPLSERPGFNFLRPRQDFFLRPTDLCTSAPNRSADSAKAGTILFRERSPTDAADLRPSLVSPPRSSPRAPSPCSPSPGG